jgi:hypothetical protein
LQGDVGRWGPSADPATGRNRVVHALISMVCFSRHCFVWPTFQQTTAAVIAGCEAAWGFFGGVFRTLIPDNLSAVVGGADALEPRFNQAFVEYAQARGFLIDPARVRSPQDKPRVERQAQFVRGSFFAGEDFVDFADGQRRAEIWCRERAGLRVHGTTQQRPAEVFAAEESPRLAPTPSEVYDIPIYATAKVHRDHHIEVARSLYSVPGALIGVRAEVRADRSLVRIFHRGQLIKVHPRQEAGRRSTDPDDLPANKTVYAMRDSTDSDAWPPSTAPPSARMHRRCWTSRCPGPKCARSTHYSGHEAVARCAQPPVPVLGRERPAVADGSGDQQVPARPQAAPDLGDEGRGCERCCRTRIARTPPSDASAKRNGALTSCTSKVASTSSRAARVRATSTMRADPSTPTTS